MVPKSSGYPSRPPNLYKKYKGDQRGLLKLYMFPVILFFSRDLDFFQETSIFFQYISSPAWAEVGVVEASVVHSHGEVDQVQIQVLHTQVIA